MLGSKERKENSILRKKVDDLEREKYMLNKKVEELSSALEGKVS